MEQIAPHESKKPQQYKNMTHYRDTYTRATSSMDNEKHDKYYNTAKISGSDYQAQRSFSIFHMFQKVKISAGTELFSKVFALLLSFLKRVSNSTILTKIVELSKY